MQHGVEREGRKGGLVVATTSAYQTGFSVHTTEQRTLNKVKVIEGEIPPLRMRREGGVSDLARPPGTGPLEEQ